ncbi:MAG: type II secretion system protein [Clostridia bacterium]|nr:type II secretion system protein [Clostridia bacterium]
MKKKGFTLVELLVVIAIIAILATVSVVGYTAFINKANQSNATTEAKQVEQAINAELMAGNDFVIGTVQSADAVAIDVTKTTYFVKASDNKVYTSVITCTAVDNAETADVNEEAWSEAVVTVCPANTSLTAAFAANADFAGLKGTFAVDANGVITYTYTDGSTATIKFN